MAAGGRRRSGLIIILVAVLLICIVGGVGYSVLGGGAASLTRGLFPQVQGGTAAQLATPTPRQDMVKIIVLQQPVLRGTALTDTMLTTVPYPASDMVQGMFYLEAQKDQVIGQFAKYDLDQGTPVTSSLVTTKPVGSEAAQRIPRGMVAVSVPMNRLTAVSYALQPGDHVNIIASMLIVDVDTQFQSRQQNQTASIIAPGPGSTEKNTGTTATITIQGGGPASTLGRAELDTTLNQAVYVVPSEPQRPRLVSQTVVRNAIVLWVGNFPLDGQLPQGPKPTPTPLPEGQTAAPAAPPVMPDILTLIVTPQDAVSLNYLVLSGAKLNMALRYPGDDQNNATEAVTMQFIMDQYSIPNPTKLAIGTEPRVDTLKWPNEPE